MVYCCVPKCGTGSDYCDPSITFHEFPSNPDLAAKWIQQINCAIKCHPMWFPRGKSVLCSKHFLSTDFKDDSDTLKPRIVPTVFGFKYIGQSPDIEEIPPINSKSSYCSPLIVKIKTEDESKKVVITSSPQIQKIISEPRPRTIIKPEPPVSLNSSTVPQKKTFQTYSKMGVKFNNSAQPEFLKAPVFQDNVEVDNYVYYQGNHKPGKNQNSSVESQSFIKSPVLQNPNLVQNNKTLQVSSNSGTKLLISTPVKVKKETATKTNSINKLPSAKNKLNQTNKKPTPQKRENNDNLIEIGPNTFLKINPDIIKINKKLTPSGNTVLQFLMDQTLANSIGADVLPKIVEGAISNINGVTNNLRKETLNSQPNADKPPVENSSAPKSDKVVQHVVGHLVDTHVCKESCVKLQEIDDILMETDSQEPESVNSSMDDSIMLEDKDIPNKSPSLREQQPVKSVPLVAVCDNGIGELSESQKMESSTSKEKDDTSCIEKAPVLLTTNMSLAHCFMEKTKYLNNLRQKARQIASLKQKVANLNKKIEELEDKCIVQERQLSFSFLKRLRAIHKNASKGDPAATYILEQIRAYTGQKQMRWSDSTLQQCAVWCRKAPYAYEYFKKADFFKLPCLGTVKRYMRKHPEMTFTNKSSTNAAEGDEDASSSDFDFDEESMDEQDKDGNAEAILCETVMSEGSNSGHEGNNAAANVTEDSDKMTETLQQTAMACENAAPVENHGEVNAIPVAVDNANLEVQELVLPSGEVVQCYSSNIGSDGSNQYYIIPNEGDQNSGEYSIIQSAESVPVILQNIDSSQIHQEQLIFITNSAEQVECTETEVVTAK